jgi:nucleoid-associated protein EbfC
MKPKPKIKPAEKCGKNTMKDLMNIMGKAREMQAKMTEMQESLTQMIVGGEAGGGMVKVELTGKFELRSVTIDPSLIKDGDAEIIEDLVVAAHNDARARIEHMIAEKTRDMTAGMPLPPGFKLPF